MINFTGSKEVKGWYKEKGPENDVVLSSRIRISRNLSGHLFPGTMKSQEEEEIQKKIISAFSNINTADRFECIYLSELNPTSRRILLERNIISQDFSIQKHKAVILRDDHLVSCLINEIDHLRLSCFHGGINLKRAFTELDAVDDSLEKELDYAVSLDLGYLNTEIANTGTGLRASVMLHLPALIETALIEKTLKAVVQAGLSVKGFYGDDEKSLGNMYQIANLVTIGVNEKEILEKLENITLQLVDYERKAREEMVEKRRIELEDMVFRAYGLLKYCKSISAREAIEHLSSIRMGIALGWIDLSMETVTALFFLTQKAHIQQLIGSQETAADTKYIDYIRAKMIREAFGDTII